MRRLMEKDPLLRPEDATAARAFVAETQAGGPEKPQQEVPKRERISGRLRRWLGGE